MKNFEKCSMLAPEFTIIYLTNNVIAHVGSKKLLYICLNNFYKQNVFKNIQIHCITKNLFG